MKKIVLFFLFAIVVLPGYSQEKQEDQLQLHSFKESRSLGGLENIGTRFFDGEWPKDVNGDKDCAWVRVTFENMPIDDAANVKFNFGNSAPIKETRNRLNYDEKEIWIFVTPTDAAIMEAQLDHGTIAKSNRLYSLSLKPKGVYDVVLKNNKTATIFISSNPTGVTVLMDDREIGRTPVQPSGVSYGKHSLVFTKDGKMLKKETIEVADGNIRFDSYDFRERKVVHLESDPSGADIYVDGENALKGRTPMDLELPYGLHSIVAVVSADKRDTLALTVGDNTSKVMLRPVKKKSVELYASYQGGRVNARLDVSNLDGSYTVDPDELKEAKPSYHLNLPYGRYKFRMSYAGNYKEKTARVKANSQSKYEFLIKPKNSIVWPWQREYDSAPMGFSMGYVTKQWVTSGEGSRVKEDVWGRENKRLPGLQVGLHFQPCFSWGLGLYTGLFYECYMSWDDEMKDNGYLDKFVEHCAYMPVHAYYRIPFAEKVALSVHGGIGLDYGIHAAFSSSEDGDNTEPVTDYYGQEAWPNRFNLSAEVGLGMRVGPVQVNASYSKGLTDHKFYADQGSFKTVQNKLGLSVSWVFGAN